jgi:hypothetical protein
MHYKRWYKTGNALHVAEFQEKLDLAGQRFSRLLVLSEAEGRANSKVRWLCRCDCGALTIVASSNLRNGHIRSCGCLKKGSRNAVTHGREGTTEYNSWRSMLRRCRNPKAANYRFYGGRGVTVCERWLSFEGFFADMGEKPSARHSLDRINTYGNYEPSNCRWATPSEQASNRRAKSHVLPTQHRG